MAWIAGVDGCKGGWVAALRDLEAGDIVFGLFDRLAHLLDGEFRPAVVAVDIPIGLLDAGERACDREARRLVKGRASSVFPAPIRGVLEMALYAEANELSRRVNGKGLSRQSFGLVPKIREVDGEVRARPPGLIHEVFPEMSFVGMNGGKPLSHSKHNRLGLLERRNLLVKVYGRELGRLERQAAGLKGLALDDLYDALATLETARRIVDGEARRVPDPAPYDRLGVPMQVTY